MLIVFRRSADTYLLPACLHCIFHVPHSRLYALGTLFYSLCSTFLALVSLFYALGSLFLALCSMLLALYSLHIGKFFLFRALITTSANHGI